MSPVVDVVLPVWRLTAVVRLKITNGTVVRGPCVEKLTVNIKKTKKVFKRKWRGTNWSVH